MIRRFLSVAAATVFLAAMTGCGADDGSIQAKIEKARIEIDATNYDGALATLKELCPAGVPDLISTTADFTGCGETITQLISEARLGQSGVDFLSLLTTLDGLTPDTNTGFSIILSMLDGAGGATADSVDGLDAAIIGLTGLSSRDTSQELSLALAYGARAVSDSMVAGGYDAATDSWTTLGGLNDAALATRVTNDLNASVSSFNTIESALSDTTIEAVNELQGVVTDIGGDSTISGPELQAFVTALP
ncbi:MAG: hypothetical protein ACE5FN_01980 [Leptospirillia bacterium]